MAVQLSNPIVIPNEWKQVWYDNAHNHILLMNGSGICATLSCETSGSSQQQPQVIYRFDTVPPSNIFLMKLSMSKNLLCIQFEELLLLVIDLQTKKRWNVELKAALIGSILPNGIYWSDHGGKSEDLVIVTNKGLELYKVNVERNLCKSSRYIRNNNLNAVAHWYSPEHRLVMLASNRKETQGFFGSSSSRASFLTSLPMSAMNSSGGNTGKDIFHMTGYFLNTERSTMSLELPPPDDMPGFELGPGITTSQIQLISGCYGMLLVLVHYRANGENLISVYQITKVTVEKIYTVAIGPITNPESNGSTFLFTTYDNLILCHDMNEKQTYIIDILKAPREKLTRGSSSVCPILDPIISATVIACAFQPIEESFDVEEEDDEDHIGSNSVSCQSIEVPIDGKEGDHESAIQTPITKKQLKPKCKQTLVASSSSFVPSIKHSTSLTFEGDEMITPIKSKFASMSFNNGTSSTATSRSNSPVPASRNGNRSIFRSTTRSAINVENTITTPSRDDFDIIEKEDNQQNTTSTIAESNRPNFASLPPFITLEQPVVKRSFYSPPMPTTSTNWMISQKPGTYVYYPNSSYALDRVHNVFWQVSVNFYQVSQKTFVASTSTASSSFAATGPAITTTISSSSTSFLSLRDKFIFLFRRGRCYLPTPFASPLATISMNASREAKIALLRVIYEFLEEKLGDTSYIPSYASDRPLLRQHLWLWNSSYLYDCHMQHFQSTMNMTMMASNNSNNNDPMSSGGANISSPGSGNMNSTNTNMNLNIQLFWKWKKALHLLEDIDPMILEQCNPNYLMELNAMFLTNYQSSVALLSGGNAVNTAASAINNPAGGATTAITDATSATTQSMYNPINPGFPVAVQDLTTLLKLTRRISIVPTTSLFGKAAYHPIDLTMNAVLSLHPSDIFAMSANSPNANMNYHALNSTGRIGGKSTGKYNAFLEMNPLTNNNALLTNDLILPDMQTIYDHIHALICRPTNEKDSSNDDSKKALILPPLQSRLSTIPLTIQRDERGDLILTPVEMFAHVFVPLFYALHDNNNDNDDKEDSDEKQYNSPTKLIAKDMLFDATPQILRTRSLFFPHFPVSTATTTASSAETNIKQEVQAQAQEKKENLLLRYEYLTLIVQDYILSLQDYHIVLPSYYHLFLFNLFFALEQYDWLTHYLLSLQAMLLSMAENAITIPASIPLSTPSANGSSNPALSTPAMASSSARYSRMTAYTILKAELTNAMIAMNQHSHYVLDIALSLLQYASILEERIECYVTAREAATQQQHQKQEILCEEKKMESALQCMEFLQEYALSLLIALHEYLPVFRWYLSHGHFYAALDVLKLMNSSSTTSSGGSSYGTGNYAAGNNGANIGTMNSNNKGVQGQDLVVCVFQSLRDQSNQWNHIKNKQQDQSPEEEGEEEKNNIMEEAYERQAWYDDNAMLLYSLNTWLELYEPHLIHTQENEQSLLAKSIPFPEEILSLQMSQYYKEKFGYCV